MRADLDLYSNLILFIQDSKTWIIVGLGLIILFLIADVDSALHRADQARYLAYQQKLRIDRILQAQGVRETRAVDYAEGFEDRHSWADDFTRTTHLTGLKRMSRLARLLTWLAKKV